jgi:uncharacterized protein YhaN
VRIENLQVGERLQTAEGAVTVEALEKVRGEHRVYNLTVEGDHEYLVGEAGIRAHNKGAKRFEDLSTSARRTVRSLEKQIAAHQKKLSDFKANPDAFDNKGFLENASPERRSEIIESRVRSLEHQIQNFRNQIDNIFGGD